MLKIKFAKVECLGCHKNHSVNKDCRTKGCSKNPKTKTVAKKVKKKVSKKVSNLVALAQVPEEHVCDCVHCTIGSF